MKEVLNLKNIFYEITYFQQAGYEFSLLSQLTRKDRELLKEVYSDVMETINKNKTNTNGKVQ